MLSGRFYAKFGSQLLVSWHVALHSGSTEVKYRIGPKYSYLLPRFLSYFDTNIVKLEDSTVILRNEYSHLIIQHADRLADSDMLISCGLMVISVCVCTENPR
jgi:hypothetical protein